MSKAKLSPEDKERLIANIVDQIVDLYREGGLEDNIIAGLNRKAMRAWIRWSYPDDFIVAASEYTKKGRKLREMIA